jgi:hypothetical protein
MYKPQETTAILPSGLAITCFRYCLLRAKYEILKDIQFDAFCALWCLTCKCCGRQEFRSNFNEHKYANNVSYLTIM